MRGWYGLIKRYLWKYFTQKRVITFSISEVVILNSNDLYFGVNSVGKHHIFITPNEFIKLLWFPFALLFNWQNTSCSFPLDLSILSNQFYSPWSSLYFSSIKFTFRKSLSCIRCTLIRYNPSSDECRSGIFNNLFRKYTQPRIHIAHGILEGI